MSKKKGKVQVYRFPERLVEEGHLEFPQAEQENSGGWRSRKPLFC